VGGGNKIYNKETWQSADGITWVNVSDQNATYAVRIYFDAIVYKEEIIIIGGQNVLGKLNDVW